MRESDADQPTSRGPALTMSTVAASWWPLAGSWLLMGVEIPAISAVVAQLPDAKLNLASFGGVIFPIALLIESPIIMMLAASTAMCRDEPAYLKLRAFMTRLAFILTLVHVVVAATPLLDLIAVGIVGVDPELIPAARIGLLCLSPWTWFIADRRFHQGLLIRFGRQRAVAVGTIIRLCGTAIPLLLGMVLVREGGPLAGVVPGAAVAGLAMSLGVAFECFYARMCARPVRLGPLREAARTSRDEDLTTKAILVFYIPIALTPLIGLASQPIGAAGMAQMPLTLLSMAAWSAMNGLGFLIRSVGTAFNEVVVRHASDEGAERTLRKFAIIGGLSGTAIHTLIAVTPIGPAIFLWLVGEPEVADVAARGFLWAAPLPILGWLMSLYTGMLVNARRTRAVTESVSIFLTLVSITIIAGSITDVMTGASMANLALTVGAAGQVAWLRIRWGGVRNQLAAA